MWNETRNLTDDRNSEEKRYCQLHSTARWAYIQNVLLHSWKRWHKEYVTSLQERKEWCREVTNLKVGDVVFITDDKVAPLQWPLWPISSVYSVPDNFVRVVKVRMQSGIYNRAVHIKKLLLPSD